MAYVNIIENFSKIKETVELTEVLDIIKSDKYKEAILKVQKAKTQNNLKLANSLKKKLLAFTPCGTFKTKRLAKNINTYNGIIIIDIDKVPPKSMIPIRQKATKHPSTLACFTSPSGLGIKILVKVNTDIERHKESFAAVNNAYTNYLGIETDPSGKDVSRLCFLSYDPELFYNPKSEIFKIIAINKNNSPTRDMDYIVKYTEQKVQYINGNRNNFIHQLACNMNREGIEKSGALSYIVSNYSDLEQDEITSTVKSAFENNTFEHDTSNKITKRKKATKATKPKSNNSTSHQLLKLETFLSKFYSFRYNIVTNRLEFKDKKKGLYKVLFDYDENTILRKLTQGNISVSMNKLRLVLNSNYVCKFDPFEEYFSKLKPHTDGRDYILDLSKTVSTDNQIFWELCIRKWIVAMVASLLDKDIVNHSVIVFSGKQGVGKTTWMQNLVPQQLKQYLYSGTINPNNKDTLVHLSECMLINLDELENLNRSEIGTLKEVITKSNIRLRRAYGHHQESLPRRASFAGSVNTKQFLNDSTGSRRFLSFEVLSIDFNHSIPLDRVLAQAMSLYKSGFQYWFDQSENDRITKENEKFQIRNVSEGLLLDNFKKPVDGEIFVSLSASQILNILHNWGGIQSNQGNIIALGKALNKHGFDRVKIENRYVYNVVRINNINQVVRE